MAMWLEGLVSLWAFINIATTPSNAIMESSSNKKRKISAGNPDAGAVSATSVTAPVLNYQLSSTNSSNPLGATVAQGQQSYNPDLADPSYSEEKNWISRIGWLGWLLIGLIFVLIKIIIGIISESPKIVEIALTNQNNKFNTSNVIVSNSKEHLWNHVSHLLIDFLGEVGVALFVFGCVSVTIESFTRRRSEAEDKRRMKKYDEKFDELTRKHQTDKIEIKDELFKSVFGVVIDQSVVLSFINSIFRENIFRTGLEVEYFFDKIDSDDNLLKCTEKLRFISHNRGDKVEVIDLTFESENVCRCEQHFDIVQRVQAKNQSGEIIVDVVGNDGDGGNIFRKGITTSIRDEKLYPELQPNDSIEVYFENISYRRYCDRLSFISVSAAENFEITVHDRTGKGLIIGIETAHKKEAIQINDFGHESGRRKWKIDGALLPGNGVTVFWYVE